jgi:hypothetical protein
VTKKSGHVHKYERMKLGDKYEVYKCQLLDCPHYLPATMAPGRLSMCWGVGCTNAVMLTPGMVHHDHVKKPMCDDCRKARADRRAAMKNIPREEDLLA